MGIQNSVLVLLLVVATAIAAAVDVQVLPNMDSDCSNWRNNSGGAQATAININTALTGARPNTTLLLQNGCHVISNFALLQNLNDISLIGSGADTIVKCQDDQGDLGLAFVNITRLRLSNAVINGCGLSGTGINLQRAVGAANSSLDLIYGYTPGTAIGVFIADSNDVELANLTIQNTPGIGMVAINLMGTSNIQNVAFKNNVPLNCNSSFVSYNNSQPNVGGGLYLLYTDSRDMSQQVPMPKLTISDSSFVANQQCNPIITILQVSERVIDNFRKFGSAGGLTVTLSQTKYSVDVTVESSFFENNTSPYGAGASIIHNQGASNSTVTFSNSIFRKNGRSLASSLSNGLYSTGGGLTVTLNIGSSEDSVLQSVLPSHVQPNTVTIYNTTFEENQAILYAGVNIRSYNSPLTTPTNQNRIVMKLCRFLRNRAPSTAAFGALSEAFSGVRPGVTIVMEDVSIEDNDALSFTVTESLLASSRVKSVATLNSVNLIIKGKSQFLNNKGSALLLVRSTATIDGDVSFINNTGSGMTILDASYIVLMRNSKLSFIRNTATAGGAIFVSFSSSSSDTSLIDDCFLWFEEVNILCVYFNNCKNITQINATLVFEDNQAQLGGTIYGSRLSTCPWAIQIANNNVISFGITVLRQFPSVTFEPPPVNSSVVSTNAFYLAVANSQPITVAPGQPVNLSITAVDLFSQSVPVAISSTATQSRLGLSGYWFLAGLTPNPPAQAYFFGEPGNNLSVVISAVSEYPASYNLSVTLTNCPFGFSLSDNQVCVCDQGLEDVECNQNTYQLEVPPSFWLGNSPTGGYTFARCVFDYCKVGTKIVFDGNIDSQCQPGYNRCGLMCATCEPGTSAVFASNACRTCSNAWLAFIIVFAVVGVLLVVAISFLGFSISEGYLNSLLFYCNVTSFFASFFAPNRSVAFVVVLFVNLSLGVETCFYDGMSALAKVGIQLLFPIYLFLIMIIIIILARFSSKISNAGFSPAKTFATLLLLCYTSIAETCIKILGVQALSGTNGTYYGWYINPNVSYGSGIHGFLIFVAVTLILVYILPFSISLLLPPLILRTKLNITLKPLLDAFWNPFKPKFRFWLGLRAILRIIPFCFAVFTSYPTNCFLLIIFLAVLLFFQVSFQPFEGKWQNILDEFFLLNLLLLSTGGVFFGLTTPNSAAHITFLAILLALAYAAFLVIFAIHINLRFPIIRKKVIGLYVKMKKDQKHIVTDDDNELIVMHKSCENSIKESVTTTYTELREPMLDYGEGEYS